MKVDLIDHMGSDLTVVNAARVSFDKESAPLHFEHPTALETDWRSHPPHIVPVLNERDQKLINYLATHEHWTPFGHCQVQFRIKAPIFVARQLARHQIGLVWNEVSRRYVDSEPEFYYPEAWRKRAENKKQGSSEETLCETNGDGSEYSYAEYADEQYKDAVIGCEMAYERLLALDVAPEIARMVLPQSMYTEWYWTGSLAAFARICKQRLDPHAQYETRVVAVEIDRHMSKLFPFSWAALLASKSE